MLTKPIPTFLAAGVAGWFLENILFGHRYSSVFAGRRVPFLPVYGFGGLLLSTIAPGLQDVHWLGRTAIYAGSFAGLELLACRIDRAAGACSWDYDDKGCVLDKGCVDGKHVAAWAALGLAAERVMKMAG